ncbi:DotA/TraY family protein [Alkalilimnicola sp. S0819]|uniref:DotA/TraY family protein n=1 Tax=Alkalilimnicola sp. S0819 TaxID=2613922 RepID=UPI00186A315B|nr:DotA/TraY family protein [Alkalilimnicola sp. S0819]
MGIISWTILVFESIVASALWAAAHAAPDGEGFAGDRGRQGYLMFLGILMRPPLMVIGFFAALVLMYAFGAFIGLNFVVFSSGLMEGSWYGIQAWLSLTVLSVIIVVVATHKVFNLVTWLPENTMRWVGQQVSNLGEQADENRMRAIFGGVISKAGPAGAATAKGAGMASGGGDKPGDTTKPSDTGALQPGEKQGPGGGTGGKGGRDSG